VIDPLDRSTWPGYQNADPIWKICHAIALAEGYNKEGSVPSKLCNPGDIGDFSLVYSFEEHSGSKITVFPTHEIGFERLYNKLRNIKAGISNVYSIDDTWHEFARKWAGDSLNWCNNVCSELKVNPDTTLRQYFGG